MKNMIKIYVTFSVGNNPYTKPVTFGRRPVGRYIVALDVEGVSFNGTLCIKLLLAFSLGRSLPHEIFNNNII